VIRVRKIYDVTLPGERRALAQAQRILREQFPLVPEEDVARIADELRNPLHFRFRTILFIGENAAGTVKGFALLLHVADLGFCFLDYIGTAKGSMGGGVGSLLYERVREEAVRLQSPGLFYECLPDEERLCPHPELLPENAARLRFYERYGARPVVGTAYETPLSPQDSCPPMLVFDPLGLGVVLRRERAREVARAIMERKYRGVCPPEYVEAVVASFVDDPVRIREPRYARTPRVVPVSTAIPADERIALVVSDRHTIHHVRERGYVEAPVRLESILREIEPTGLFERVPPRRQPEAVLLTVHDADFVRYLRRICLGVDPGESVYPYVFPIRNTARPPRDLAMRAGYYCIDTFTPLNRNAYVAARRSVDCAVTAADELLAGRWLAYALVRPPGHHAERRAFGGFCYFNAAAIAAERLAGTGKVAVLDVDYHHGNGTERIFWERADVLTISIHAHPNHAYPYFSGFAGERGGGAGLGFSLNIPLPEELDGPRYLEELGRALERVRAFAPRFLVLSLGLDTAKGDPTGSWTLRGEHFAAMGRGIGALRVPTLVVQEGGYRIRTLGQNARHFFVGLREGAYGKIPPLPPAASPAPPAAPPGPASAPVP